MSILTFKCGFKHVFEGGRVEKMGTRQLGPKLRIRCADCASS